MPHDGLNSQDCPLAGSGNYRVIANLCRRRGNPYAGSHLPQVTAVCLRRPILFACPKRIGRKTAIKGRAFYKDALPLIIPSSDVPNKSEQKKCQQCSTERYLPINSMHFSIHGAGNSSMAICLWLIRAVLTKTHLCRHLAVVGSVSILGGGVHRGGRLCKKPSP